MEKGHSIDISLLVNRKESLADTSQIFLCSNMNSFASWFSQTAVFLKNVFFSRRHQRKMRDIAKDDDGIFLSS